MDPLESPALGQPRHGRLLHIAQWLRNVQCPTVKGSTIDTYISELRQAIARYTGYQLIRSPLLEDYLRRIKQLPPPTPSSRAHSLKLPVTKDIIKSIISDATAEQGCRVAILCGFDGMLRVSEYTSHTRFTGDARFLLLRSDIDTTSSSDAITVRIKKSKSDPAFQGPQFSYIARPGDSGCPVSNLTTYLHWFDANFSPNTPLFRRDDGRYLTRDDVDALIKKHAALLGFNPDQYSTHGLRYGGAFELAEADIRANQAINWDNIIARGRWHGLTATKLAQHYARFSEQRTRNISNALRIDGTASARTLRHRF